MSDQQQVPQDIQTVTEVVDIPTLVSGFMHAVAPGDGRHIINHSYIFDPEQKKVAITMQTAAIPQPPAGDEVPPPPPPEGADGPGEE